MGKKSQKKHSQLDLMSSVIPLLEFKLKDPLFSIAAHPSKPQITLGLASGYIFMIEYNPEKLALYSSQKKNEEERKFSKKENRKFKKTWKVFDMTKQTDEEAEEENDIVKIIWKTKRHKGSVRSICFNAEGTEIFTAGSDNVIKRADAMTGKVIKKTSIDSKVLITKILKCQAHPILVTGDEAGNVRVFDTNTLKQTNCIQHVHEDSINDLVQLVNQSAYQFLSVGSTTVSVWDTRKEKVKLSSEDQEDEILSCTFVDPGTGETLVCGMGEGIVTIWKPQKNNYADQLSRVKVSKNESVDCVISTLKDDHCIWAGSSDGMLHKINTKRGQVIETRVHSKIDEVSFLDIDYDYRLISGGMDKLKIWSEKDEREREEEDEEEEDEEEEDEEEEDEEEEELDFKDSSIQDTDEADEEVEFEGFSDTDATLESPSNSWKDTSFGDEDISKNGKLHGRSGLKASEAPQIVASELEPEYEPKKTKKAKLNSKQLRNRQAHEHGIRRFEGL